MATYTTKQQKAVLDCLSERADSPVSAAARVSAKQLRSVQCEVAMRRIRSERFMAALFDPILDAHRDAGLLVTARGVERSAGRELLVGVGARDLEDAHARRGYGADARSGVLRDLLGTRPCVGRSAFDERQLHVVEFRIVVVGLARLDRYALRDERRDFARDVLHQIDVR